MLSKPGANYVFTQCYSVSAPHDQIEFENILEYLPGKKAAEEMPRLSAGFLAKTYEQLPPLSVVLK